MVNSNASASSCRSTALAPRRSRASSRKQREGRQLPAGAGRSSTAATSREDRGVPDRGRSRAVQRSRRTRVVRGDSPRRRDPLSQRRRAHCNARPASKTAQVAVRRSRAARPAADLGADRRRRGASRSAQRAMARRGLDERAAAEPRRSTASRRATSRRSSRRCSRSSTTPGDDIIRRARPATTTTSSASGRCEVTRRERGRRRARDRAARRRRRLRRGGAGLGQTRATRRVRALTHVLAHAPERRRISRAC